MQVLALAAHICTERNIIDAVSLLRFSFSGIPANISVDQNQWLSICRSQRSFTHLPEKDDTRYEKEAVGCALRKSSLDPYNIDDVILSISGVSTYSELLC